MTIKKGVKISLIIIGVLVLATIILFVSPSFIPKENSEVENQSPVVIPSSIEKNCIGFVIGAPEEMQLINEIGGAWARPHPGPFAWQWIESQKGDFDFSQTDEYVLEAQKNNIAILGTIWPYADWDQAVCNNEDCKVTEQDIFYPRNKLGFNEGIPKSRCIPCNFEDYDLFLTKLVERYDGDGINDMPNLEIPIKYWEVLNEPEMKGEDMTFFKGTSEEYAEILKNTEETIKSECSDCKVLHGGMAGTAQYMQNYWKDIFSVSTNFDIANIHYIRGDDLTTLNVNKFKSFLGENNINTQVWVTEAEYNSDSEIENSVTGALNAGASKIFFTQFKVGQFGLPPNGEYSSSLNGISSKCK